MAHYDTLIFPLGVSRTFSGGPRRRTIRFEGASGQAVVNALWSNSKRTFDAGGAVKSLDDVLSFITFWEEARGNLHSWLLCDPFDFRSCAPTATIAATDQAIGTGDAAETDFQLVKTYGTVNAYTRTIKKPVNGTLLVAVDGVTQTETTHYTVDYSTGVISFVSPPADTLAITAGFQFYTPVRFSIPDDQLPIEIAEWHAGAFASLPIEEVTL